MRFKPSVVGWRDGRQMLVEGDVEEEPLAVVRAYATPAGTVLFRAREHGRDVAEACRTLVRVNSLREAQVLVLRDRIVAGPPQLVREDRAWMSDGVLWVPRTDATAAELAARLGISCRVGVPERADETIRLDGLAGAGPVAAELRREFDRLLASAHPWVESVELWPAPHAADAVA